VVGTDRRLSLFDVAARAKEMKKKGEIPRTSTPRSSPRRR
jgi:hypothetical protein